MKKSEHLKKFLDKLTLALIYTSTYPVKKYNMKTKIYFLMNGTFLFLFLELSLNAQSFKYGVLGGFDIVKAHMTNMPDKEYTSKFYDPMISYNVNGYFGYKSEGFWGISIEPGFIQKGGAQKFDKETKEDDVRVELNYIQIPVLFDVYLNSRFFFSIGPELAYMVNARAKSIDFNNDIRTSYTREFEISSLFGINLNVIKNIDIGLRYNHGITNLSEIIWLDDTGREKGIHSREFNQYLQLFIRLKI